MSERVLARCSYALRLALLVIAAILVAGLFISLMAHDAGSNQQTWKSEYWQARAPKDCRLTGIVADPLATYRGSPIYACSEER